MTNKINFPEVIIKDDAAPVLYTNGGLKAFVDQARQAVENEVVDATTKEGRARGKSLARQVSSSKNAIEKPGRDYLRRLKEAVKPAEQELRWFVDEMDKLRDDVRRPVDEWESKEKQRIEKLNEKLSFLRNAGNVIDELGNLQNSQIIESRLETLKNTVIDESWLEIQQESIAAKDASVTKLEQALIVARENEAQVAELSRLRREAEDKKRHDEIERVKREAADLARITAEAEADRKLQTQRNAAARAEAEAKAERDMLQQQALLAEARRKKDIEDAENRARFEAEKSQREHLQEEQRRQEEQGKREADKAHRQKIFGEIMDNLVQEAGIDRVAARAIVVAIAARKIAHTQINF
ncbi:TPA: hypothetical protein ACOZ2P_001920 [Yersinia enterocolitica]|uniref:hypothetical protein n=1 Tax=Yersinia enterocolitica TaxID=630 RepID=UPI001C60C911|nr:hypothetical protein [Yersinia enterocolitica]EKN6058857.1 hypothetical protein [Yersinia enterocolitica]EKN6229458.1 hypothetical protein [Yersinia enterocolitica]MBW5847718.1 hypothetical protein [Yersinia enterocolitica]MBW5865065.1 hypothetical protein [Yersinia enterocolitica]